MAEEKFQNKLPNQEIDYFKIGKILVSRWYWVAGMVLISMSIAKLYLWYTPKVYSTFATLKFEDKRPDIAELSASVSAPDKVGAKVQSEMVVLRSTQLILRAIKDLDYRVSFSIAGRVRTTDQYPNKPLNIQFLTLDTLNFYHGDITFTGIDRKSFSLVYLLHTNKVKKVFDYDQPVTIGPTTFILKPNGNTSYSTSYIFKFNGPEDYLGRVFLGLQLNDGLKNSDILSLTQNDQNPVFAADFINALMTEYLKYDREQKTKSASQIITFINSQITPLAKKEQSSQNSIEQYKQNKKIVDMGSASDQVLSRSREVETQQRSLKVQEIGLEQLKTLLVGQKDDSNVNFNLSGVQDPLLGGIITNYNAAIIEREDLLRVHIPTAVQVIDVNQRILNIKRAALNNINSQLAAVNKNIEYLNNQATTVNQQISALPTAQTDMLNLQRDFDITDKVYSILREKKLDAEISRSAIVPGATVVDQAKANFTPIAPDVHSINSEAIVFGFVFGLGIIILIRMLNPYIYDKETVESLTTIPIIGVIRKFPVSLDEDNSELLALSQPRSVFAESVRAVRTNLNFLASELKSKVICVTSEVAGEGKSFVAVNLSSTLALINKKVILIGADLRRSRIHKTFKIANDVGLSSYLANQATTSDIIHRSEVENLDFITSGPVPPNPSELLHSPRMAELLTELKAKYDMVVVDTAPIGLVSDSIPLIRSSDINVFVIRSGKSKFYAATIPQRIAHEYHLNNTVIVLNAFEEDLLHSRYYTTKFTGENYGSRYYYYSDYSGYSGYSNSGYYVEDTKKKWWDLRRWLS